MTKGYHHTSIMDQSRGSKHPRTSHSAERFSIASSFSTFQSNHGRSLPRARTSREFSRATQPHSASPNSSRASSPRRVHQLPTRNRSESPYPMGSQRGSPQHNSLLRRRTPSPSRNDDRSRLRARLLWQYHTELRIIHQPGCDICNDFRNHVSCVSLSDPEFRELNNRR